MGCTRRTSEVGETLAGAAQRELLEETGIIGQITKLLGIFDSRLWRSKTKAQLYHVIFLAETTHSTPKTSKEAVEVAFFGSNSKSKVRISAKLRFWSGSVAFRKIATAFVCIHCAGMTKMTPF